MTKHIIYWPARNEISWSCYGVRSYIGEGLPPLKLLDGHSIPPTDLLSLKFARDQGVNMFSLSNMLVWTCRFKPLKNTLEARVLQVLMWDCRKIYQQTEIFRLHGLIHLYCKCCCCIMKDCYFWRPYMMKANITRYLNSYNIN